MNNLTAEFKSNVRDLLLKDRTRYGGSDAAFAKKWDINSSVWSRMKNGALVDGLLRDTQLLNIARELGVSPNERQWKMAKTQVLEAIMADVEFCQAHGKGMILVDDCAIGKTFTGKYLSKTLKNCFYVDASQGKNKSLFIRNIARAIGLDTAGRINDVKAAIKYYLKMLESPVIILDEAGDLEYTAMLELKELWNATEGLCGWYLMGADGLRAKIERGIRNRKVGFRELFSRYSDTFMKIVPTDRQDRLKFYEKLSTDVMAANIKDKCKLPLLVKRCLAADSNGDIGGLRNAETLLILNDNDR